MTTTQQHLALQRANDVRLRRARLKSAIRAGALQPADVLRERAAEVLSWSVGEMLVEQRSCGPVRAERLLDSLHISYNRPIGALTERQIRLLIGRLESR